MLEWNAIRTGPVDVTIEGLKGPVTQTGNGASGNREKQTAPIWKEFRGKSKSQRLVKVENQNEVS